MPEKYYQIFLKTLVSLAVFIVFYSLTAHLATTSYLYRDADLNHIPSIVHNLIYEHGHLSDWDFAETPFFFPDLFISYVIGLFNPDFVKNILIYALIQVSFFLFIVTMLLKLTTHNSIKASMGILLTLTIFLLSNELLHNTSLELFSGFPSTALHFGSTLMVFIGLYLFLQCCIQQKTWLILLFFILMVISILSDILVGFYLTIPLIITIAFCWLMKLISFRKGFKLISFLGATTLCGYLLYQYFPLHYFRSSSFIHYQPSYIKGFINILVNFFQQSPSIALLWLTFIIFAPISLIQTFLNKNELFTQENKRANLVLLYLIIMILWAFPAFIITDHNIQLAKEGSYLGLRHLQPFFMLPIFIGLPLLLYKHTHLYALLSKKIICGGCFILLIVASLINMPSLNIKSLMTYYPPEIACLDNYVRKMNLHAGLGNYWQARTFSDFNHTGTKLVAVNEDFSPFIHINSMTEYKVIKNYDFIIVKSPTFEFDKNLVIKRFGNPTSMFTCPGNYEYYVYGNNTMKNLFNH